MYTHEQKEIALNLLDEMGSITSVIQKLGYPTQRSLYNWISPRNTVVKEKTSCHYKNTAVHPRNPSVKFKLDVIHRCFELGEMVELVSEEIGYGRTSIYVW